MHTNRAPTNPSEPSSSLSNIVQNQGKDIKTCAKEVKECEGLRVAYAACKRGQVDPRSRIRGNKGY